MLCLHTGCNRDVDLSPQVTALSQLSAQPLVAGSPFPEAPQSCWFLSAVKPCSGWVSPRPATPLNAGVPTLS